MALTADNSGRIQTQPRPSGTSMPSDLAALIAQSMAAGAGGATATGTAIPPLRINLRPGPATREVRTEGKGWRSMETGNARTVTTLEEAVNAFYLMDEDYRNDLQKKMWFYGLIDGPNNTADAIKVWGKSVEMAAGFSQSGKEVSPIDMFAKMTNLKAGQLGNQPRTVTQRQINFTDPEQAKTWIREAFQSSMGRDPHDAEIRQMLRGIASGNSADPQVMRSTTDSNGNTTQEIVDPGFDPTAFIKNQLAADPEAAASQAAGTLYPALLEALASPV